MTKAILHDTIITIMVATPFCKQTQIHRDIKVMNYNISRFIEAQENTYETALAEIKRGRKTSHWIWFIFPQIKGLGRSMMCQMYAIHDLEEAKEYLQNELLRTRLITICEALLEQDGNIREIMGSPDDKKVRSCVTLFREADSRVQVFQDILDKFYGGKPDYRTLSILKGEIEK